MPDILKGIRVLDLSRYIAGPYAAQILSDMGAEVIKVEKINGGDETRTLGPWKDGTSLYYPAYNRGKKSVCLDFRSDEGKATLRRLIERSDVLIENFRVGTMEKMGLSYPEIQEINPGMVVASVTGFGQTGPYKDRAAFDSIVTFMSGLMWIDPESLRPMKSEGPVSDTMAAVYAALGVVLALYERKTTGKGQLVDVSMLTSSVAVNTVSLANYAKNGQTEAAEPDSAPQGPCRTKDGWVSLHAGTGPMFKRIKELIDDPQLHDEKYEDVQLRIRDRDFLMGLLEKWMADKTSAEVEKILSDASIPVGVLGTWDVLYDHPQMSARNDIIPVDVPGLGPVPYCAFPAQFSRHSDDVNCDCADLGRDNLEVFTGLLGMTQEEAEALPNAPQKGKEQA